jgi:2,4-dichlorophenol 6-monooxygenase
VGQFVLIAGEEGEAWCRAALVVAAEFGVDVHAVTVGHAVGDFRDPRLRWQRVRGFGPRGAVLVRPDRCVAWRSMGAAGDAEAELRSALRQVLSVPA